MQKKTDGAGANTQRPAGMDAVPGPLAPTCTGAMLRRTMRRMTQIYDDALRPFDLKLTQYSVLANLFTRPGISITDLADLLQMDRTTLSRNLGPLRKRGLVTYQQAGDSRRRDLELTEQGLALVRQVYPVWRRSEFAVRQILGEGKTVALHDLLQEFLAAPQDADSAGDIGESLENRRIKGSDAPLPPA